MRLQEAPGRYGKPQGGRKRFADIQPPMLSHSYQLRCRAIPPPRWGGRLGGASWEPLWGGVVLGLLGASWAVLGRSGAIWRLRR